MPPEGLGERIVGFGVAELPRIRPVSSKALSKPAGGPCGGSGGAGSAFFSILDRLGIFSVGVVSPVVLADRNSDCVYEKILKSD